MDAFLRRYKTYVAQILTQIHPSFFISLKHFSVAVTSDMELWAQTRSYSHGFASIDLRRFNAF